jgi:hypothetical protein
MDEAAMTEPADPQSDQSTELGSSTRSGGDLRAAAAIVAHGAIVGRESIALRQSTITPGHLTTQEVQHD